MDNYKITNLTTKEFQYMNEKEKNTFQEQKRNIVLIFGATKYHYLNISEIERKKKINFYNNIIFTLGAFIVAYLSIFAILFIFSEIDKFIFSL
tara:strand:- start:321 stop:599 length:279 start_codon:yes stop_codon:yes gene_type:complete